MRLAIARSLALVIVSMATAASAQVNLLGPGPARDASTERVPSEYRQTVGKLTPSEIIQQKAQAKAADRQARIAARAWYGYSQARPKTPATPFSGLYGPQFQGRLAGRPMALYPQRSVVVLPR